jgi:two-component system OmpR family sensor kinase
MSIRLRLALIAAMGLAVLLASTGFAYVHQLRVSLTASAEAALWAQRSVMLRDARDSAHPPLAEASQVLTAAGRVVTASGEAGRRPLLTPAQVGQAMAHPVWLTIPSGGADEDDPMLLLGFALRRGGPAAVGVVGSSLGLLDAAVAHVTGGFLLGGPVAVVLGALAAWLFAGAALHPVERMRRQAAAAAVRDTIPVLAVPSTGDEVARLARTLNALLDRLRGAVARERAFAADAGHELRTPLSILRTELELADRPHRSRAELAAAVHAAVEETDRLARLAEDLLLLARGGDPGMLRIRPVILAGLLERAAEGMRSRAEGRQVVIRVQVRPGDLAGELDEDRIRQVADNLLDNAIRHAPHGGEVTVGARGYPDHIELRVTDNGPGFPAGFLPHALERFSRADSSRSTQAGGAGLGLSVVAAITAAHGGHVRVGNLRDGGAEVTVDLPSPSPERGGRPCEPSHLRPTAVTSPPGTLGAETAEGSMHGAGKDADGHLEPPGGKLA